MAAWQSKMSSQSLCESDALIAAGGGEVLVLLPWIAAKEHKQACMEAAVPTQPGSQQGDEAVGGSGAPGKRGRRKAARFGPINQATSC